MQKEEQILPLFLQMDNAVEKILPTEGPFIKGLCFDTNGNPSEEAGAAGGTGEGYNQLIQSPVRSSQILATLPANSLPPGYNKNCGSFFSVETNEFYYANFNGNGNHGIYVVNCDTGVWNKVIIDTNLPFTDNQEGFLAEHRWSIRFVQDADKNIVAKFLLYTNGDGWQGWINVIEAIATNGFDATLFPYWQLTPPHFDRRELLEWAMRPPMYAPVVATIPNTEADTDKVNRLIDTAFQVAIKRGNTDGRISTASPYSLPLIIKSEDYLNNPDTLPKNSIFTLDAGSCMTEIIQIFIRKNTTGQNNLPPTTEWTDWYLYDTIYKFSGSSTSESNVLGTPYWLRTNPWANYKYDPNLNTIQYTFDNSNVLKIVDQTDFIRLQNDIPQLNIGLTDLGDGELLVNGRRDYDNLSGDLLNKLSVNVAEKMSVGCPIPTRKIRLYAYIGRCQDDFVYVSQVGYFNGSDTEIRFGGLTNGSTIALIDFSESKTFDLNFSDKRALRCYLKGTPFYTDGNWYQVNADNSLVLVPLPLDFSNTDVLTYVQNVFSAFGYFICVFDFVVPAGRYIATLGRHNVASSGDYRNTSTYIEGIANSRATSSTPTGRPGGGEKLRSLKPTALVSYSKEMELDCTSGDIDVWGNGSDVFYVYCPYVTHQGNKAFRFVEGYLQESPSSPIGVELFPYQLTQITDDSGRLTDKNGFYFAYTKAQNSDVADVQFICRLNCQYPTTFSDPTNQGGSGWRPNGPAYISDHNSGVVGDCNRVLLNGKITSLDGTIGYSNIAVSIKDGQTVLTKNDGTFTLIIHNGQLAIRVSNVYVNAGGNFLITIAGCGNIPITQYNEGLIPCINCQIRTYPLPLNLQIFIQNNSSTSLKQGGKYSVGLLVADLAGRLSFVNIIGQYPVSSFIERQDTLATFFQLLINGALNLDKINPDFKWVAPVVSPNLTEKDYTEWVGDNIQYIDNNGNAVTDPSEAVYCSIAITSLYNYNIARNFSTLASYQFTPGDRIRIYDDGDGNLLKGNPIDLKVLGQNYNQAAMTAGLIPSTSTVPVVNNNLSNSTSTTVTDGSGTTKVTLQTVQNNQAITLFVLYDARLTPLINDTGFWIELYTPADQSNILSFAETQGFLPVISGEVAKFTGYNNGIPAYDFPIEIDITFWDTYLFPRNITIPNIGDKFFSHDFESQNISDTFGYKVTSGGRVSFNNPFAKQMWYTDEADKSDNFVSNGLLNGIGTFRSSNRKRFIDFKSGPIVMVMAVRNVVFFLCENDFFVTDYNFQYIYANAQGVAVANLNDALGSPHQKIGSNYGMIPEDTGTVVVYEEYVSWYDRKNQAWVLSDYQTARDISLFNPGQGVTGGMSSYLNSKTRAISGWNKDAANSSRFDVIGGVDIERGNLYLTFRPRRNNSNDPTSYGTTRRNVDLLYQETLVYNTITKRFVRFESFTPEAYGKMKGKTTGIQLISFAAGIPNTHNTGNTSFNNFYGIQYDPVMTGVFNQNEGANKIFENICLSINGPGMYIDFLRTNEPNSFSYIPMNMVNKKENKYYLALLRDMVSYFGPFPENEFRSTLIDGKRIFNNYLLFRLIGDPNNRGKYFELKSIYNLLSDSTNEKK